ncbi:hypothetical protein ILYODFUR_039132, partial [Ilyodon furcidens]
DSPPTLTSPMLRCSVSTLLDLAESISEEDTGCQSSFHSWNQPLRNQRTILPAIRLPSCPPFTSFWKHLPKRIQVTERHSIPTDSHRLPNSASSDRLTFSRT